MLLIKVLVSQEQSDITIELDGAPFIRWKGATKALGVDTGNAEESALLTSRCAGLISENSLVVCHSARLRMLSGEAKLLHAAAK